MFSKRQLELLLSLSTARDFNEGMVIGLQRVILDGWNPRLVGVYTHTLEQAIERLERQLKLIETVYKDNPISEDMRLEHLYVLFEITNKRELTMDMRKAVIERVINNKKYKDITAKYPLHRQSISLAVNRLKEKHLKIKEEYS
ncbi:hypothetical protein [Aliivibrio fischeri]|uniref:hypothetical protein n=1 Tax=Aliivibrio fischeri TaxID=668 RepID=UPI00128FEF79|nr:hypothetical protein [Aliivibrio fischeri]